VVSIYRHCLSVDHYSEKLSTHYSIFATAAEYAKVRARDEKKKSENYQKNVQKAFKFEDFTQFYLKRGTSEGGSWLKAPALGHRMAKTKYDYSGSKIEDNKLPEAFKVGGGKKK
jgi:hypothetical protein